MNAEADPDLSALLGDVMRAVDEDIAADPGCPDLAAVVAMAHELDPQRVPAEAVHEVGQWAPVVSIQQGHRRRRTRDDPELLEIIEGVRSHVEEDVAQRLGTPPPVVATEPEPEPRRKVWLWTLAAAAVLLLVGASVLQAGRWRLVQDEPSHSEASLQGPQRVPEQALPVHSATPKEQGVAPEEQAPEPEPEPVEMVEEPEAAIDAAVNVERPSKRTRAKRPALSLEELDAAAHAAWRAGDLPEAERLFRLLAKRAGKARLGDLAYGDLFTLARQTKSPRKEASLWREYLRRFPKGRFADDARAGLCRRAGGDAQRKCWQRYLDEMPEGAHRAQARRAVASVEDSP